MKPIEEVAAIPGLRDRAYAAAVLAHQIETALQEPRAERAILGMKMIAPFVAAVGPSNDVRTAATDAYRGYWIVRDPTAPPGSRGKKIIRARALATWREHHPDHEVERVPGVISTAEYEAAKEKARQMHREGLRDARPPVKYLPADVCRLLGVSRGQVNKWIRQMPATLPRMRVDEDRGRYLRDLIGPLEATQEQAREIRDTAALTLMSKGDEAGHRWTNKQVADLTSLTTARIAQMRKPKARSRRKVAAR